MKTLPAFIISGLLIIAVVLCGGFFKFFSNPVAAADTRNFHADMIISDAIFTDYRSMSASAIQSFLVSKNSVCLKDFETLSLYDADGDGLGDEPYGKGQNEKVSAAQLIWQASQIYRINPKVILATLEKEQGLVTRSDCPSWRYNTALGYGCPDNEPCDTSAYGFTRQIDYGVWHFRGFFDDDYPIPPYTVGSYYIAYNPSSSCGGKTLTIRNRATAALYSYTPYQPNAATLAAAPGETVNCGAYGNLNFWRYFTDWFGSTTEPLISSSGLLIYGWNTSDPITAIFDIKNTTIFPLNVDYIRVRAFNEAGDQYIFWAKDNLTLSPGQRYKYEQSLTIDKEGDYTFVIDRKVGSSWYPVPFSDFNYSGKTTEERTISHKPELIESLELDKSSIHVNEPVTATFDVINNSAIKSVNVGLLKVDGHDANGTQYQFDPTSSNLTLTPGQTYTYSDTRSLDKAGKYTFEVTNNNPNLGWNTSYPQSDNASIIRRLDVNVKTQATITEGLTINQTTREGDTITAAFKLRNFGTTSVNVGSLKVEAYGADGTQYEFEPTVSNLTLTPGQEYTYTESRTAPPKGSYTFRIVNQNSAMGWNSTFPMSETSNLVRSVKVNVKYPADITASLSITPTSAAAGTTRTATFKVRNFGTTAVNLGQLKVEAFSASGQHYQFAPTGNLVLAPGQEYTYSASLVLSDKGSYSFRIVHKHPQFGWLISLPPAHDSSVLKTQTITVQ